MMIIMKDREIIARNLINIIDVKNCQFCDLNDKLIQVLRSRAVLDKVITNVF